MSIRTHSSHGPTRLRALLLASAFALAAVSSTSRAHADDDPMAPYRERFKTGMERYTAGDLASAISTWESIYREVGPEKGYRIAFDLARAYDKSGDLAHAADRYQAFLAVVDARKSAGVALDVIVVEEESDARARLAHLAATNDPLHPEAPPPTDATQVPALPPSTVPPSAPVSVPVPAAVPVPVPVPVPVAVSATVAAPASPHATARPFSPVFLFVAGGATVAAIAVCSAEYANALSLESRFKAAAGQPVSAQSGILSSYDDAQSIAYGTLAASLGLAAITGGLTVWYLAGSKAHEGTIAPVAAAIPGGAVAGVVGRF